MVSHKPYVLFSSLNENYHRVASSIKLKGRYDLQRIATDSSLPVSLNTVWRIKHMTDELPRSYTRDLTAMPPEAPTIFDGTQPHGHCHSHGLLDHHYGFLYYRWLDGHSTPHWFQRRQVHRSPPTYNPRLRVRTRQMKCQEELRRNTLPSIVGCVSVTSAATCSVDRPLTRQRRSSRALKEKAFQPD
jgi:hypothetical protein